MAEKPLVEFFQAGATSFIKHFCDEVHLVERINHAVRWDPNHWKLSPGDHVMAMVINTLCGRFPLSRVQEFYQKQDVEVLFGKGVTAADFNDDALGRTLDRLYEADPKTILTSITLESFMTSTEPLLFGHADTTSKSFYGDYNHPPQEGVVQIVKGFNKDNQRDAKQIIAGLVTVNNGIPMLGNICNGNQDDPTWNADIIHTIGMELDPDQIRKLVLVSDSKFFSEGNVRKAQLYQLKFISLVSQQHKLREEAIEAVLSDLHMTSIGQLSSQKKSSEYHYQEIKRSYHGIDLRLIVVHSTHLFHKKKETFHNRLNQERAKLEKETIALAKQEFSCDSDAENFLAAWLKKHQNSLFPFGCSVQSVTRPAPREGRGRPKKEETPEFVTFHTLQILIQPVPAEILAEQEKRMGYFVLATNVDDAEKLPASQVLREYKLQSTVELRFKFLKDPAFINALFLKTPERIEALGYLLMLCLYFYMIIEQRLRLAVEQQKVRLQPVHGTYTGKPTSRQILLLLATVTVMMWYDRDDQLWYREVRYANNEAKKVFDLLKFDPKLYTLVPERPTYCDG